MPARFAIDVPQAVLDRIARQVGDARIGYAPGDDADWRYGTDAAYLAELVAYWRDRYDWRAAEASLNRFAQYVATIDGIAIHFYHVRGDGSRPLPVLLTHGWPGSVVEFQAVIPLLVAGGYDVIVPSLPGHGWSARPPRPIGPLAIARLWRRLMVDVLGYRRFIAQGGDWGWVITRQLALLAPAAVAAIHLNFIMPPALRADSPAALAGYWEKVAAVRAAEGGYAAQQATKPQTAGLALHDNPVGWAAWVVEKFHGWGDTGGRIESAFSKDQLLTNLMTYLVNDAVASSFWLYRGLAEERMLSGRVTVPTGVALFPREFYPTPARALAEPAFAITRWTAMPRGGHFAAFEQPELFAEDVLAFAATLD